MIVLLYILLAVYFLSINAYGVLMLIFQRKERMENENDYSEIKNSRLFFTGVMGGALGIFVFMIIKKYQLKNMLFMVAMPVLIALNVYLIIMLFRSNFLFNLSVAEIILSYI